MTIFGYRLIASMGGVVRRSLRLLPHSRNRNALARSFLLFGSFFLRRSALAAGVLCVSAALPAFAQLEFESSRVQIEGKFGEGQLHAAYPFENKGDRPVTVQEVTSGCGCTVPELEQKTYQPGEKGILRAVFSVGQRQGEQRQTITVKTDAGDQTLRLIVHLPVRLDIAPRILLFRGSKAESKTAVLTFAEDLPVTVESVTVSGTDAFAIAGQQWLEPDGDKKKSPTQILQVEVKPLATGGSEERALVQIRSKGASGNIYNDYLHLRKIP